MANRCCADKENHTAHGLNNGTRRWCFHQSLTIVYQQSFAHNTYGLLTGIIYVVIGFPTCFRLHTCLSHITHILLYLTVSVLLSQHKQFIRVNRMSYIAHTLIWLTISFVLPNHKQFVRVNRTLYIADTFICQPISFVPPHRKQLIELNHMPCIAHATKIRTVFDASSIANVLQLFWRVFTPVFAIIASHTVLSMGLWY